jgi:hypothetical protein
LEEIKRLLKRMKYMSFKIKFNEMVKEIKNEIVDEEEDCEEVK